MHFILVISSFNNLNLILVVKSIGFKACPI